MYMLTLFEEHEENNPAVHIYRTQFIKCHEKTKRSDWLFMITWPSRNVCPTTWVELFLPHNRMASIINQSNPLQSPSTNPSTAHLHSWIRSLIIPAWTHCTTTTNVLKMWLCTYCTHWVLIIRHLGALTREAGYSGIRNTTWKTFSRMAWWNASPFSTHAYFGNKTLFTSAKSFFSAMLQNVCTFLNP